MHARPKEASKQVDKSGTGEMPRGRDVGKRRSRPLDPTICASDAVSRPEDKVSEELSDFAVKGFEYLDLVGLRLRHRGPFSQASRGSEAPNAVIHVTSSLRFQPEIKSSKMVSFKNVFLLATAVVASVLTRDASKVLTELQVVNGDAVALTAAITVFKGSIPGGIAIRNSQAKLHKDLQTATTVAKSAGPADVADARRVLGYILTVLEPAIKVVLRIIRDKKAVFDKAGFGVLPLLKEVQTDTAALGLALLANTLSAVADDAKAVLLRIEADLAATIKLFS
ncbi:hypothetical protein E4U42_008085 [Claviceps africana]|uniref:Uncharacterized protein n=1 Tax=Claviceps africana TaxID=83212 RepID=A0A8K0NKW8_9HYPO|nr:hypothetical protein E4U42_008085 [Claviceps africana]